MSVAALHSYRFPPRSIHDELFTLSQSTTEKKRLKKNWKNIIIKFYGESRLQSACGWFAARGAEAFSSANPSRRWPGPARSDRTAAGAAGSCAVASSPPGSDAPSSAEN